MQVTRREGAEVDERASKQGNGIVTNRIIINIRETSKQRDQCSSGVEVDKLITTNRWGWRAAGGPGGEGGRGRSRALARSKWKKMFDAETKPENVKNAERRACINGRPINFLPYLPFRSSSNPVFCSNFMRRASAFRKFNDSSLEVRALAVGLAGAECKISLVNERSSAVGR